MITVKPTRRELIVAISRLQDLVGRAQGSAQNDRSANRLAEVLADLGEAFDLCITIVGEDRQASPRELEKHAAKFVVHKRRRV